MAARTFNDRMMARTVVPVIYCWIAAAASVVYTGITKPEVVLQNLDGFIALIAIIGGVALPALNTLLRTWESEKANEIADLPVQYDADRIEEGRGHDHSMHMEKEDNSHKVDMERNPNVKKVLKPKEE